MYIYIHKYGRIVIHKFDNPNFLVDSPQPDWRNFEKHPQTPINIKQMQNKAVRHALFA